MKLIAKKRFSFPALNQETFHGLPGLLADALPDKFGNALIDEYLTRHGTKVEDITAMQRLLYVGRRAMGALEFEPAAAETRSPPSLRHSRWRFSWKMRAVLCAENSARLPRTSWTSAVRPAGRAPRPSSAGTGIAMKLCPGNSTCRRAMSIGC